ncbi:MAG: DNA polymerase III subunit alpha, partial [Abditibacteriota bacterium]|nr:DNA polymerase III subunit alpha [Abditibacteriota bacterium]
HGIPEEKQVAKALLELADEMGLKAVCTNDSHYTLKEDSDAHDTLLCIQTKKMKSDPDRMQYEPEKYYIKSGDEMLSLFPDRPDLCANTLEIAEKCNVKLGFNRSQLPDPGVPAGISPEEYMITEAEKGLKERLKTEALPAEYTARLKYEAKTINDCGFPLYMLIVRDFTDFARRSGIYVGVRGSAASSLVGYGLGITDVDPIEYGLTFERFLNPERVEMPDIDLDIQDNRRDELINYVSEKYGRECVSQISTFSQMKARGSITDCGRVLGMELKDVKRISDMVDPGPKATIKDALETVEELKNAYEKEPEVKTLIDTARKLEGVNRARGIHAAGVLISARPLDDLVPIEVTEKAERVAQLPKTGIERVGLLKMDFLGLGNLTILADAVENVKKTRGIETDRLKIPLDDKKTFDMLGRGETNGVFQLESPGMTKNVVELKPNSVRELAAIVALFRPGPMAYIPKFIKSKFGAAPITYTHPVLEPILKETYGVICYQEQVLKIAQAVGGFSLGKADILRKAMSKKKKQIMDEMKSDFIKGALENDINEKTATDIFEQIEPFAGYAFNKAHAVCYAHLAYQTAYMKANYPAEYYAALLSANKDNTAKLANYIRDLKSFGIKLLPPDINSSFCNFTVEKDDEGKAAIRFGLGAIKGIGQGIVDAMTDEREKNGPFSDPVELAERTAGLQQAGKSLWEILIKLGCFDSIFPNRQGLLTAVPEILDYAAKNAAGSSSRETGLFDAFDDIDISGRPDLEQYKSCRDFRKEAVLEFEKELAGIYFSGHPLESKKSLLASNSDANTYSCGELADNSKCTVAGIISSVDVRTSRKNQQFAKIQLEDLYGTREIVFFNQKYEELKELLQQDKIAAVTVRIRKAENSGDSEEDQAAEGKAEKKDLDLIGEGIRLLGDAASPEGAGGRLIIRLSKDDEINFSGVKLLADAYPGKDRMVIELDHIAKLQRITTPVCVDTDNREFINSLQNLVGGKAHIEII